MPDPEATRPPIRDVVSGAAGGTGLIIRRITSLDPQLLDSLVRFGRSALGESALDEWMLPVLAAHGFLFTGSVGDEIAGAAEVLASARDDDLYLEGFYIRPEFQGCGYGAALLAGVCQLLRSGRYSRLLATVAPENAAARRLYEKTGFVRIDYLKQFYGPGRDRLLVALPLKEEA